MKARGSSLQNAIIDAAAEEFSRCGFDGATMSDIAERTKCSKATLYNHFKSKDELFLKVMMASIRRNIDEAYSELENDNDIFPALRKFGIKYLAVRQSPDMVSLMRLAFGEAGRSDIGRLLYQRERMKGVLKIEKFISWAMNNALLRRDNSLHAAEYFLSLLESRLIQPVILRARMPAEPDEIKTLVDDALGIFSFAYLSPQKP